MRRRNSLNPKRVGAIAGMLAAILVSPCFAQWQNRIKDVRLPNDWAPVAVGWNATTDYFSIDPDAACAIDGKNTLLGFVSRAYRDSPRAPLPDAYADGYRMRVPWLHDSDLFPLLGHLYDVGTIELDGNKPPRNGAMRVPPEKVPPGIQLRYDTYAFALSDQTDNGLRWSGSLHGRFLYFWALAATKDAKPSLQAKVGTLVDDKKWPLYRVKDIVWRWYREGDWVEIGEYRHKLLKIVPPREPKELNRGTARMVGWIELDRHAEPLPAPKPNEKKE